MVSIVLIILMSLSSYRSGGLEDSLLSLLDQTKLNGGKAASRDVSLSLASRHFDEWGVKRPSEPFKRAIRHATLKSLPAPQSDHPPIPSNTSSSISEPRSSISEPRSVVLMAMANSQAFTHTVPLFVRSMKSIQVVSEGSDVTTTLADHLVVACDSKASEVQCRNLISEGCFVDEDLNLGDKALGFHSLGFNAIGFAKVKYILNTLSIGVDAIFLDADILVFSNFVPYVLSMASDVSAMVEKCKVVDDQASYSHHPIAGFPMFNIGITYFKSRAGVIRCVYSWIFDMWQEVKDRPNVWDQDVFRKVFFHCARHNDLHLQAFSPRVFNSHCYKPCGCNYSNFEIETSLDRSLRPCGRDKVTRMCPSPMVSRWMLMHFPCSGVSEDKAKVMLEFKSMFERLAPRKEKTTT